MVRINGLVHILIHGIYWGVNSPADPNTFDPNFLRHPSGVNFDTSNHFYTSI